MSNVFVDKNKIDLLANAISAKSGESLTLTLDEMVEAVDGIESGGGGITPTGNIDITQAGVTDVTNYATATVPQGAIFVQNPVGNYNTVGGVRKFTVTCGAGIESGDSYGQEGYVADHTWETKIDTYNAVPKNTTVTPTESSQTIGGYNYMMEGAVTVNAIPSNYVGTGVARLGNNNIHQSGGTVYTDVGYYEQMAGITLSAGTEGTPTATKGTVSNHAVSVTPSVTNTAGYISGGTKTGTAVSVSASELVSGDKSITANGNNIDVANYSTVSVNVSGGSSVQVGTSVTTLDDTQGSIQFNNLLGEPSSFVVIAQDGITTGSPSRCATCVYDGTNLFGQRITNTSNAQVSYMSGGLNMSYNSGTLTISSSGADFQAIDYALVYTYGGGSACINTEDVQVGSGATSITFTGLDDEPEYFSCVFKSDFGTSSGYQRTIAVVYDGTDTYGMEMDSSAKASTHWSYTYSNGTLTITSQGTNVGGYFHQPGYYQLTYAIDVNGNYQTKTKTYTPTTSQQTETITADNGYDALKKVNVTVNAMPTMTLPSVASATSSGTSKATITQSSSVQYLNIPTGYNGTAQYYTISASGGGTSKNVQVLQSTSRTNSSSLTKVLGDLTVSKTGTYDIYWSGGRSNTSASYTWGTRLYVDGSGYGTENTSWSNNCQSNHLSNVSLTANQKLSVYARGRSGSYYTFVPLLVIMES